MFALHLNAERPLGDLVTISGTLLRRPYPNLVFHLSMTADDEQVDFLSRFAHDLHTVTGRHTAFLPLVDTFETTASVDRRHLLRAGEAIPVTDIATHFNERGRRWVFDSLLATRAAESFGFAPAEIPCWVFVDASRSDEVTLFPAPSTDSGFDVFRRSCERYGEMINESTLGETLAQLETTSSRARTAFERVRSANHDCSRLEGDPDVQRRVSRREQWEREVANFLSGYSGLPNLDEADLRSEALIAVAADIGLDYGITPIDARQNRSPEYRRHVKNLPPHLGKQLAAVFAPLEPLDRRDRERERYRLLDAEQAALWEQVRLELEAVPPLADVYTQELESHTRDARRFARKIRLTSVAEDVRRLLDAFNSIGGPA